MNIFEAIILGIVQGLTEFLPVSSSGHLVLLQRVFKIEQTSLFFDTMLHAGTLAAVFIVLWKDILSILKKPFQRLTGLLIIATIPAVIAALTLKDSIESIFISAKYLGWCFLITTALLVTAEILSRRSTVKKIDTDKNAPVQQNENKKKPEGCSFLQALFIGIMQAIAIPPGISRSGATISGALFCKLDRDFAARFSFLLSIPAILGAVVLQAKDLIGENAAQAGAGIGILPLIAGTLTAAVVGFFAVKFMLKIIREKSLFGFAIYTFILGVLILIDQFASKIVF
ncbi:MAG: undecaprenyl-diphosphate phosphatase [Treponema sp.]|nr:undecaprenyl-diphosphate phosphatase [Treponema sp.]